MAAMTRAVAIAIALLAVASDARAIGEPAPGAVTPTTLSLPDQPGSAPSVPSGQGRVVTTERNVDGVIERADAVYDAAGRVLRYDL